MTDADTPTFEPSAAGHYDFTTVVDRTAMGSSKWWQMHRAADEAGVGPVPEGIPPFSVADLDLPNAPEIIDGMKEALDSLVLGYTVPTPRYREVVAAWMAHRHDWQIEPEWICPTPGIVPAFTLAIRELTAPGDGVIIQTPAYYPFFGAIEDSGRHLVRNELVEREGRFRLDLDQLEEQARDVRTTMLLLASPHNPTGRVWEREELEQIARIACEHDLLVLSDEIHCDVILPGHEHTVLTTLGPEIAARTIVLTSPSKSFNLAGLQLGNAIISDAQLRERFIRARDDLGFDNPSLMGSVACELAYTRAEGWLDAMIDLVGRNHRMMKEFFAEHLPQVRVMGLEGTYLQWVDFRGLGLGADEMQRIHVAAHVYLDEGTVFGPEGAGFSRFVIAAPTDALRAALERLRDAYKEVLAA